MALVAVRLAGLRVGAVGLGWLARLGVAVAAVGLLLAVGVSEVGGVRLRRVRVRLLVLLVLAGLVAGLRVACVVLDGLVGRGEGVQEVVLGFFEAVLSVLGLLDQVFAVYFAGDHAVFEDVAESVLLGEEDLVEGVDVVDAGRDVLGERRLRGRSRWRPECR